MCGRQHSLARLVNFGIPFMANKSAILLVHGMGNNTPPQDGKPGSFGKEFIAATTASLQQFKKHAGESLSNYVDIHEFNYNVWFDQMRTTMANNAKYMTERLAAVSGIYGASVPLDLASKLNGFEAKFGDDSFFYTHCLDVIFYGTMLGAKVRVDAAAKIAELVENYGGANVHVIAHSLGTAVVHDTLHLLYRPEHDPDDKIADLDIVTHQLGSVWMFANVSRLVNSVSRLSNPLGTVVRPGVGGCTASFFNVRHALDPFTWLAQFNPPNNGSWISESAYTMSYRSIVTDLIIEANTHSFPQYLSDPHTVERLIPFILGTKFQGTLAEFAKLTSACSAKSLNGAYAALDDALKGALQTPDSISGWMDFLNTAKKFEEAVKHIKENF